MDNLDGQQLRPASAQPLEGHVDGSSSGLTDEQRAIVDEPPSAHVIVNAGPGTGKTHVLVHRIAGLVAKHDIAPGSEVLLLTFSRAAVAELRRRVQSLGGRARFVRAVTFDSFATRLLNEFKPNGSWVSRGYDGRIEDAVRLLQSDPRARREGARYRHVFVDEIQDVVGLRDEFLREILRSTTGGWTLLGDPAQGIYNFQLVSKSGQGSSSSAFLRWIQSEFDGTVRHHRLTHNFRVQNERAGVAIWAGEALNNAEPDTVQVRNRLRETFWELRAGPPLRKLPALSGTTAVLCQTNGQALLVSRRLWKEGVSHRLQRASTDRALPVWLAAVLNAFEYDTVGRTAFDRVAEPILTDEFPSPNIGEAWRVLKRLSRGSGESLSLGRVLRNLRDGIVPDELAHSAATALTVSTIHRAKGLEYDRVLVLEPDVWSSAEGGEDAADEARLSYVAMTRPRLDLLRWSESPDMRYMQVCEFASRRWVRWHFRAKRKMLGAIEVQPSDTSDHSPVEGESLISAAEIQEYLASQVGEGDAVNLVLRPAQDGGPLYEVQHDGRAIAETSIGFAADLKAAIGYTPKNGWPSRIDELRVDGIETVIGAPNAAEKVEPGGIGAWLRPRLVGIGELRFG